MNKYMAGAAALLFLTTWVHVFLGGPEIHNVIQASTLSPDVRAISAVLWHAVTVILMVFGCGCLWLTRHDAPALAHMMIAVQLGFAALFVFYGITLLDTLWIMPQWVIFLVIPAVMLAGLRGRALSVPAA